MLPDPLAGAKRGANHISTSDSQGNVGSKGKGTAVLSNNTTSGRPQNRVKTSDYDNAAALTRLAVQSKDGNIQHLRHGSADQNAVSLNKVAKSRRCNIYSSSQVPTLMTSDGTRASATSQPTATSEPLVVHDDDDEGEEDELKRYEVANGSESIDDVSKVNAPPNSAPTASERPVVVTGKICHKLSETLTNGR